MALKIIIRIKSCFIGYADNVAVIIGDLICWSTGAIRGRRDPGTGTTPLPGVIRRGFRGIPEAL